MTFFSEHPLVIVVLAVFVPAFLVMLYEAGRAPNRAPTEDDELPAPGTVRQCSGPCTATQVKEREDIDRKIEHYFAQKRLEIQEDFLKAKMHKANAVVRSKLLPL